jgi:nicotinate-nucleotide--dimethylbenzimidazole phosphoribosyltransferase
MMDNGDDPALRARLQSVIDGKTKPIGALGRIEALALQIGMILRSTQPVLREPQLVVFAADHGIAAQGVSAYPQAVTRQMVLNMAAGGAAVNVFARQMGLALTLVDAGVADDPGALPSVISRRIGPGTRDASIEPAMTESQCRDALQAGRDIVAALPGNALLPGEMGIANTSAASLLLVRLGGVPLEAAVGRGTGLDDAGLRHKTAVLARALDRHAQASSAIDVLAAMGGFEIAMMAGAMIEAAQQRRVIVIDGFVVGAALLAAEALAPGVRNAAVFAHRGAEAGHAAMLGVLQAQPLLDLGLRLGEGSGAALAWPLLQAAAHMLCEMASFESAGVSTAVAR